MIQISNLEEIGKEDVQSLLALVNPVLQKRKALHERYSRLADENTLMYSDNNKKTKVPFEKFLTDLATGYLAGAPVYEVEDFNDTEKSKILNKIFDKEIKDVKYQKAMKTIIDYITNFNDDYTHNYDMIHDLLEKTACYEIVYENKNNEIVYTKFDALQTVGVWDYNTPANLIGLVRTWDEKNIKGTTITKVEIVDKNGTREYDINNENKEIKETEPEVTYWGDVPAVAVETDFSIFEPCEDIICAYEQLVQNTRNTYEYNDNAKLKITGYQPENPLMIEDEKGNEVPNPAREKEDETYLKAKVFYTPDNSGDVDWITKNVDANGILSVLKMYVDLLFQLAGIPNTSDLAFNGTDLNASAIDRKFYVMKMKTIQAIANLKKAYLRRWELIFDRINLEKNTKFDFRDINITLTNNLPNNQDEVIDSLMKLQGVISNETIVTKLGYNYASEKQKLDEENQDNLEMNIQNMKVLGKEEQQEEIPQEEEEEEVKEEV